MTTQVKSSVIANSGVTAKTYGNSGNVVSFAVGSDGRITSASNTAISASAITAGTLAIAQGGTNSSTTPTSGAVAYGTGSAIGYTAAGSSGQYLQSNGSSAPSWATVCTAPPTSYGAVGTYMMALAPGGSAGSTVAGACLYYARDPGAGNYGTTFNAGQSIIPTGGTNGVFLVTHCNTWNCVSYLSSLGLSGTWRRITSGTLSGGSSGNYLSFLVRVS